MEYIVWIEYKPKACVSGASGAHNLYLEFTGDPIKRVLSRNNMEDIIIDSVNYFILALIMVITLYPFINTLA